MEPIISLRKQNMFFVEMESESTLIETLVLNGWQTITTSRHEHLQSGLLDCDFCVEVRYHNTLIFEDEVCVTR